MRWYIVHAYSNFERKVAESIKERLLAHPVVEELSDALRTGWYRDQPKLSPGYQGEHAQIGRLCAEFR